MTSTSPFWCAESIVVSVSGPQGRSTTVIEQPFARIGSHTRSEIVLTAPGVDARSLYLHATSEGVYCVRMQPLQGMAVGSGTWLKPDETLCVGPYEISARLQRPSARPPPRVGLTAWGSAPPPLPVCEVSSQGNVRDKRRFRARLNLVGRKRDLALQIQGQQVSGCHCALFWESGKLWCIDLLSSNGTLVEERLIDCALVAMGESIQVGEFSIELKRLSRATARPSSWRTGESDEELLAGEADHQVELPGSLAQTSSVASGDTRQSPPGPWKLSVSEPAPVATQATELLRITHEELRQDQERLREEFSRRSRQLVAQRQQLDQQWIDATQAVASQVSRLQDESALLAAQRLEMAKLRADWEEQRRLLTSELLALQQELPQLQGLLPRPEGVEPQSSPAGVLAAPATVDEAGNARELVLPDQESPRHNFTAPEFVRDPRPEKLQAKTVIEGTYVVEKEEPPPRYSQARINPELPSGRRPAAGSIALTDTQASAPSTDREAPFLPPAGSPSHALVVSESDPAGELSRESSADRRTARRKARAEQNRTGEFVTDQLVLREVTQQFWLRMLWCLAATVAAAALLAIGYIVLTAQ
jgi:pSer/pThr/pTyr-binding forkhead associated (FHA) protein